MPKNTSFWAGRHSVLGKAIYRQLRNMIGKGLWAARDFGQVTPAVE
jgi:hypothetical protein